jgi:hypothetical protein
MINLDAIQLEGAGFRNEWACVDEEQKRGAQVDSCVCRPISNTRSTGERVTELPTWRDPDAWHVEESESVSGCTAVWGHMGSPSTPENQRVGESTPAIHATEVAGVLQVAPASPQAPRMLDP